jgi:hypothetical protein
MNPPSYLVQILLPKENGNGQRISQQWFETLLEQLTDKFGGATSFIRAPGEGLWDSGGDVARDNIAVIEVMTDELDRRFWRSLRGRLEGELSQEEIVIRAQQISRL